MLRYLVARHPVACTAALVLAFMLAARFVVTGIVEHGGHIGFVAMMVAIFAFAFWWERRFPSQ